MHRNLLYLKGVHSSSIKWLSSSNPHMHPQSRSTFITHDAHNLLCPFLHNCYRSWINIIGFLGSIGPINFELNSGHVVAPWGVSLQNATCWCHMYCTIEDQKPCFFIAMLIEFPPNPSANAKHFWSNIT